MGSVNNFKMRPKLDIETLAGVIVIYDHFILAELSQHMIVYCRTFLISVKTYMILCEHWIRVHGDCHSGNILWRDNNPHFVDFDDANNQRYRIYGCCYPSDRLSKNLTS